MPAGADGDLVNTAALFLTQRYACVLPKNVCPGDVAVGELSVEPIFRFRTHSFSLNHRAGEKKMHTLFPLKYLKLMTSQFAGTTGIFLLFTTQPLCMNTAVP